jgi:Na+/melibiose symporter-like transporter
VTDNRKLKITDILKYSQSALGLGFVGFLVSVYLMKYSTDVLMMSPIAVGAIMFVSRFWDAISDPLVGYFSDKTSHKLGRRRPWVLFASFPATIAFVMIWSPPSVLAGEWLVAWMALSILLFFSAATALQIPIWSWGAELTDSYTERTTLFGIRHGFSATGILLAVGAMYFLATAENVRLLMLQISLVAGVLTIASLLAMVWSLDERSSAPAVKERSAWKSYVNVAKNGYARILISSHLVASIGQTFASVFTLYVSQYILGGAVIGSLLLMIYLVTSICSAPLWIYLSKRFNKRQLWLASTFILGGAFGFAFFLSEGAIAYASIIYVAFGLGASGTLVISPSIQSDLVDFGECTTGKRTEGAYFATWYFAEKAAMAITFLIAGLILELSDFVPNAEQTESTKTFILIGFSVVPMFFYMMSGALIFLFKYDEEKHKRVHEILARKRAPGRPELIASARVTQHSRVIPEGETDT